jgi:uncharacterized protein (DUF4415 family)
MMMLGFTVDDEAIIETVARMHAAAGETEAAALLRSSRCRFEETGYDNWDGGTYTYTLYIEVAAETFVAFQTRREVIEQLILARLKDATKQFRPHWYVVELAPLIVSMPGRPDLEGGPVSHSVRRAIVQMLQSEGVGWQGALNDVDFLLPIYDLDALPSTDSRFKTAGQDIWQHRINNPSDWPEDWVYSDERFRLIDGPDVTFLAFIERMVSPQVRPDIGLEPKLAERISRELERTGWSLARRDSLRGEIVYRVEPFNPVIRRAHQSMRTTAAVLSSTWMHQELSRIEAAIDTDPALAIGTAKEMVETCCKHISDALKLKISANPDMPELTKVVLKALRLVPEDISESAKGAETVKRTLSNLSQVTQGLSELRKLYGTGHGRSTSHKSLSARHARLAVGAAAVFIEFVTATYIERQGE